MCVTVGNTEGAERAQPFSALRGNEESWAKMVDEPHLGFLPMTALKLGLHGMKAGSVYLETRVWGAQDCLYE